MFDPNNVGREYDPFGAKGSKFRLNIALLNQRKSSVLGALKAEFFDQGQLPELDSDAGVALRSRIRKAVNADPAALTNFEKGILLQLVLDELFGFGPLGALVRDPQVGDIHVNGPMCVSAEIAGELVKTNVEFENNDHLLDTINRLLRVHGMNLNEGCPTASVVLENGHQITAALQSKPNASCTLLVRRPME